MKDKKAILNSILEKAKKRGINVGEKEDILYYPLLNPALLYLIGGDLPANGTMIELFGAEGSGKTTLALHIAKAVQEKDDRTIIYFQNEINPRNVTEYAKRIGIDTSSVDRWLVLMHDNAEEAFEYINQMIKEDLVSLVIVDSVAFLIPMEEKESSFQDQKYAPIAKLLSKVLKRLAVSGYYHNTFFIFVNQLRYNIDNAGRYASKWHTPGGKALAHAAHLRLELRRISKIKRDDEEIGAVIELSTKKGKNKLYDVPKRVAQLSLYYGYGFDIYKEILDFATAFNIVKRSGAYYSYGTEKFKGKDGFIEKLKTDDVLFKEIYMKIREKILNSKNAIFDEEEEDEVD